MVHSSGSKNRLNHRQDEGRSISCAYLECCYSVPLILGTVWIEVRVGPLHPKNPHPRYVIDVIIKRMGPWLEKPYSFKTILFSNFRMRSLTKSANILRAIREGKNPVSSKVVSPQLKVNFPEVSNVFLCYISFLNITVEEVTGRFVNVLLVRQRAVRQRMMLIRQCPGSVCIFQFANTFWKRSEMYLQISRVIKYHLCKMTWVFISC